MDDTHPGVRIGTGPAEWQLIQRRLDGRADIPLAGDWTHGDATAGYAVEVRLLDEATNRPPETPFGWRRAEARGDGTWSLTLADVPAGGPYRIETRLCSPGAEILHGDHLHHIAVGDLWIIAGQSNAVGIGRGPAEDPPEIGVHLFPGSEVWRLAAHPLHDGTRTRHPASRGNGKAGHSAWLAFGRRLRRRLGVPIGLLPTALGGSPLSRWDPGAEDPDLFHNMLDWTAAAGAMRRYGEADARDGGPRLAREGARPGPVAGMLWYQGCSDGTEEALAASYEARFRRFLHGVREALDAPALPVLTVQINRHLVPGRSPWNLVREAQRRIACTEERVALLPTLDLPLSDCIHIAPEGNLVLAERAACAALGMAYGLDVPYRPPAPSRLVFGEEGRDTLLLDVSGVREALWHAARATEQFLAADARGEVAVREVQIDPPARIRLRLERALGEEARLHNGEGADPVALVFDADRRPLVAFHDFPVGE